MIINPLGSQYVPSIVDRLIKKVENPIITAIAIAILVIAVTTVFSPFMAVALGAGAMTFVGGWLLLGAIFGFDKEEQKPANNAAPANTTPPATNNAANVAAPVNNNATTPVAAEPETTDTPNPEATNDNDAPAAVAAEPEATDTPNPEATNDNDAPAAVVTPGAPQTQVRGTTYEINMGLPNTGNTCWLNSSLKFMASSDYFDTLLAEPSTTSAKDNLRKTLRAVIAELRTGKKGMLSMDLYRNLQREIAVHLEDHVCNGTQRDAVEFMMRLTGLFDWNPPAEDQLETMFLYETENKAEARDPMHELPTWYYPIVFHAMDQSKSRAQLDELATRGTEVYLRSDITGENIGYFRSPHFSKLPDNLLIHLDRAVWNEHNQEIKIQTLLATQKNGIIELVEEEVTENNKTRPKRIVHYQIQNAIVQSGTTRSGHYVCHTRNSNGLVSHSDSYITEMKEADFGVNGYFIHLRKIDEQ